jgi:hypothetical protein
MNHRLARTILSLTVAAVPVLGLATAAHALPGPGFGQIPPVVVTVPPTTPTTFPHHHIPVDALPPVGVFDPGDPVTTVPPTTVAPPTSVTTQPGSPQPQPQSPGAQNANGAVASGGSDTTNPGASDLPLVDTLSSTDAQPSSSHSVVPVVLAIAVALAAIAGLGAGIVLKRRNV